MAELKVGKFTISPQSGDAGTHTIVHRLNSNHTGRKPYSKIIKASIKNNTNISAIETLTIDGAPLKMVFDTTDKQVSYNTLNVVFSGVTNCYGLYIENAESNSSIVSIGNGDYSVTTVSTGVYKVVFPTSIGEFEEANVSIKFVIPQNNSTEQCKYRLYITEMDDGDALEGDPMRLLITQDSSDASFSAYFDPEDIGEFSKNGGTKTVNIFSNTSNYSVHEDASWVTISNSTPTTSDGTNYTSTLSITVASQEVAAVSRSCTITIKSNLTQSVLATAIVSQEAGDPYSISWLNSSITFTSTAYSDGVTENNTLTANSNWDITESV